MADRRLTGVLLLGGASSRFGGNKALAVFAGETLAERARCVLAAACDEVLVVGKAADALELPFPVLDDGVEVRHPAAGIAAALRHARNEVCVVLPVDCPLMTPEALAALGAACADAAWPVDAGPLPGAYRRTALPAVERALAEQRSLRRAIEPLDVRHVVLPPEVLVDVDTAADLAAIDGRGSG